MPQCGHICLCEECAQTLVQHSLGAVPPTDGDGHQPQGGGNIGGMWDPSVRPSDAVVQRIFGDRAGPIYINLYAGMGCAWVVKRADRGQPTYAFFMHSDNWGQYGPETDDSGRLSDFLEGYQLFHR
jgi:hypothetical protein